MERSLNLEHVRSRLRSAVALRGKYTPVPWPASQKPDLPPAAELQCQFRKGLLHVVSRFGSKVVVSPERSIEEFYEDMGEMLETRSDGAVGTFCFQRLKLLQLRYDLYMMANFDVESEEQRNQPHRDFYNVRKVDTHVHHSAAMNAKHLLRFIKKKLKKSGDDVVHVRDGKPVTLSEVCRGLGIGWDDLSLDKLNVVADQTVFHRFDNFNSKYNPLAQPELRTIFLKTDNEMNPPGIYLAEVTKELLRDLEESKYQHTEWRLSIYGRSRDEWSKLAKWVIGNNLLSPNNRWMIQVPRLYDSFRASGKIHNFQEILENIYLPMFEASVDTQSDPELTKFLSHVSGFDCVDDESKSEKGKDRTFSSLSRSPEDWTIADNPSYKYYNFYLQSNLRVLNRLRLGLGQSQFQYRPHAGEAGELHHLDTAFLLADSINHGINLAKSMPLQYLYYLCNIGLALTPCSNNNLFLSYGKQPFSDFFARGLNVSLGTDDPLMFHQTREPLMEEYSLAKQFFRLSSADLCELARNSVLQSGFPGEVKAFWLGSEDPKCNIVARTNLPQVRFKHRARCRQDEMHLLHEAVDDAMRAFRAGILAPIGGGGSPASPPAPLLPTPDAGAPPNLELPVGRARTMSQHSSPGDVNGEDSPRKRRRRQETPLLEAAVPHICPEDVDCFELPPLPATH